MQETGGGSAGAFQIGAGNGASVFSRQGSPLKPYKQNLKIYSYGYLFKSMHLLELFLNFLKQR
jgi:hypothetical protein